MPQIRRPAAKLSPTVSCFEDTSALESRDQAAHVPTPLQNVSDNCVRNASDASLASVDSETTGSVLARCRCTAGHTRVYSARTNPQGCTYYEAPPRLYMRHEAPSVLQFNPHIKSGYRAGLSYFDCACSIFQYHNETGNILSHLAPLLIIVFSLACGLIQPWEGARTSYHLNMASMLLMLSLSVAYHTFSGNHHTYHFWLHLDVCGILLVMVGGAHFPMWWGLHCDPVIRAAILGAYYGLWCWAALAVTRADKPSARAVPLLGLLVVRVISLPVRAFLIGGPHTALQHYVLGESVTFLGGIINALRIPERWVKPDPRHPGVFDYWLNAHQLMHVAVVVGMWQMHLGAAEDYRYWEMTHLGSSVCPA